METRANYIAIGSFALLTLLTVFVLVGWLVSTSDDDGNRDLRIVFPGSVTGLAVGGLVYFNGIKVGEVAELSFDQDDPTRVIAVADVGRSTPLREDTRAVLGFSALTGVAYVELAGGSSEKPLLFASPETPTLQAERSGFQDLVDGARQILSKADKTLTVVNGIVGDNRESVNETVKNITRFSEALASNSEGVEKFMAGVSDASAAFTSLSGRLEKLAETADNIVSAVDPDQVKRVVDNVANASDQLENAAAGVGEIVENAKTTIAELKSFGEGLNTTLRRVDSLVAAVEPERLRGIVGNVEEVTGRVAARSDDIDAFIDDAKAAADSLRAMSASIGTRTETITRFIDDAGKVGENLSALSGRLGATLDHVDGVVQAVDPQKVASVVESVDTVTRGIASETEAIRTAIADAQAAARNVNEFTGDLREKKPQIDAIVADAKEITTRLNAASEKVNTLLTRVDTMVGQDGEGFIAEATAAARSIRIVAETFQSRAGPIADGFARFSGRGLRDLQALIEQGRRTLERFERTATGIEQDPSRVIFGGSGVPVYDGRKRR